MIDFQSSTAQKAEDGRIVIAIFDGEPVVVMRCSADAAVALLVNVSLALAERGRDPLASG